MLSPEEVLHRCESLQTEAERTNFENLWRVGAEIVHPESNDFYTGPHFTPGQRRDRKNYDATATQALLKFAAVMESLLTPREKIYHQIRASDSELQKDSEVKRWFEELNLVLFRERNDPNAYYYSQKHMGYMSLGAFGNECLYVERNPKGGVRYRSYHMGQIYVDTDHMGVVDSVYRKFQLSAHAAMTRWGEDKLPERVRKSASLSPGEKFWFVHAAVPNPKADPEALDYRSMPWTHYEISVEDRKLLRISGYKQLPFLVSRYVLLANEKYGRGPTQMALASILGSNQMKRDYYRASHLAVEPPLLTRDDHVLRSDTRRPEVRPGRIHPNTLDQSGNPLVRPLETGTRIPEFEFLLKAEQMDVQSAYLVPFYEALLENPQMTATQVLELSKQTGIYLAPLIGRQHSEMLAPQIRREISILMDQERVPPPPPLLVEAEGEYEIVYDTPGTRQQRVDDALAITRTVEVLLPFIQQDPQILNRYKSDEIAKEVAEINGMPSKLVRSDKEMDELNDAIEQQQRAAEASAQSAEQAQTLERLGGAAEKFSRASGGA